jgi:hypothetical protein
VNLLNSGLTPEKPARSGSPGEFHPEAP